MKQPDRTSSISNTQAFLRSKALAYIRKVKRTFIKNDEPYKYESFLRLLDDNSERKFGIEVVRDTAEVIFRGHEDLILGLNEFLPEGCRITIEDGKKKTKGENIQESWKWKSLLYIAKVEDAFKNDSTGKLEIFDYLITDFGTENFDFDEFGKKLKRLFKGHNELILEFNEFMPEGNEITIDNKNNQNETGRSQKPVNLVEQVKLRFPNNKRVSRAFKDILLQLPDGDRNELYKQFSAVFRGQDDLIDEFYRRYVKDNQSNQVENTKEKPVRKLRSRRYQLQHVSPSNQHYRTPLPRSRSDPSKDESIWRWGKR